MGRRDRCANESHWVELHLFEPVGEQAIHVIGVGPISSSYFRSIISNFYLEISLEVKVRGKCESGFNFDQLRDINEAGY